MKHFLIVVLSLVIINTGFSQFKPIETKKNPYASTTGNLILGFFNPKNFSMSHSFNVSMLSSSYGNISLTTYTNSMNYKFNDKLSVSADVSMQYSPFASSVHGASYSNQMQKDFSGVFLSRASVDYKISDNSYLKFEYRNLQNDPYGYYNPFYNGIYGR
ncbi:MAG: hypothetical protein JSS63_03065 [Bacteroidetes bacterium]|nr:hypothetical protein [Bacteroidota bacterium]MBX7047097.1 hypothetical protein [Ignavibacteria bacterium]